MWLSWCWAWVELSWAELSWFERFANCFSGLLLSNQLIEAHAEATRAHLAHSLTRTQSIKNRNSISIIVLLWAQLEPQRPLSSDAKYSSASIRYTLSHTDTHLDLSTLSHTRAVSLVCSGSIYYKRRSFTWRILDLCCLRTHYAYAAWAPVV